MKRLLILITISVFCIHGNGQPFEFKQIGLTFTVPPEYTLVDSTSHTLKPSAEIEVRLKQFVFRNNGNGISFIVSTSTQQGIDWNNIYQKEAKHFYDQMRIRKPEVKYDSSFSTMLIGTQLFNKFTVTGKENNVVTFTHVDLYKYFKGYKVHISYYCSKPENSIEIENSLKSADFLE